MTTTPPPRRTNPAQPSGKLAIIGASANQGFKIDILAYKTLAGSNAPSTAQSVYYANQTGLKLEQVRITLNQSEAVAEAGTLHYMRGHLELDNPVGGVGAWAGHAQKNWRY